MMMMSFGDTGDGVDDDMICVDKIRRVRLFWRASPTIPFDLSRGIVHICNTIADFCMGVYGIYIVVRAFVIARSSSVYGKRVNIEHSI